MRDRFSSNALSRMGRRGFLKTLAGLGVSASTAGALTQSAVAEAVDDPRREVPRVRAFRHTNHEEVVEEGAKPEREPVVYTIPRWRWARIEAAHKARRKIAKRLPGKHPVWVTTDNNGDKKIVVEQSNNGDLNSADIQKLDEQVPASVKGVAGRGSRFEEVREVPVDIERPKVDPQRNISSEYNLNSKTGTLSHDGEDLHYRHDWEEIPAGAFTFFGGMYNGSTKFHGGTTGFPVYNEGERHMITAGHNWDWDDDEYDVDAKSAWADNIIATYNNEIVNDVNFHEEETTDRRYHGGSFDPFDCTLMSLGDGADRISTLFAADSNGGTRNWPVYGALSQDGLRDLEDSGPDQNETLYQQGAATGLEECAITGIADYSFKTNLAGGSDVQVGDSGGPISLVESDPDLPYSAAYAGGIISSNTGGTTPVFATSAYVIENEFNVTV